MKYTIKITDENGKVLLEQKVNAMIAGLVGDDGASGILLKGTHEEMLVAANVASNEMNKIYEEE